ncbi:peptidoglycan DD-metalloendopeptidase family protein [Catenovulum sp. 2E275]|uniref:peptidoglycan DD-metalloendopeptidase family protein n=1 Tax=Catenovulum sp. 2E275 TaxID=2980497 RepID=UPI0021D0E482|nr:peptidoglycan DD-metalloendopeptidase family protein [Catenovulum sp. 2E275]MCU4676913.1 peptidoglycan DD-metalloendopeptidase family protein [Catenovulum sp. 2E275]
MKLAVYQNTLIICIVCALSACAQRNTPAPVDSVYRGKSIHDFQANSLRQSQYKVSKGDTLYSIAFRAGVDFKTLARLNDISAPYSIYPGQIIRLNSSHKSNSSNQISKTNKKKSDSTQKTLDKDSRQEYVVTKGKQNVTNGGEGSEFSSFSQSNWQWPAKGKVIERFSYKELGNKGLDIIGKKGEAVFAANSGKVVYAGNALRGYGNLIIIKHSDDYLSAYAHNSLIRVKEKDWVKVGQHIADMGDTDTNRVKLHFEIRFKGNTVNPEKFLPKR